MALTSLGRKYSLSLCERRFAGGQEREFNFAENGTWGVSNNVAQTLRKTYLSLLYFAENKPN